MTYWPFAAGEAACRSVVIGLRIWDGSEFGVWLARLSGGGQGAGAFFHRGRGREEREEGCGHRSGGARRGVRVQTAAGSGGMKALKGPPGGNSLANGCCFERFFLRTSQTRMHFVKPARLLKTRVHQIGRSYHTSHEHVGIERVAVLSWTARASKARR